MNKEKLITKKEENILNKEFKNLNKSEEILIKEEENFSKLNETKSKMGEKIEKRKILDNSTKKGKLLRALIVAILLSAILIGGYFYLKTSGLLEKFNSLEEIKQFILSGGNLSIFIFILIQFLQVTLLPIPAIITTIAGSLIFGPWQTFIVSFLAIMLGSIFAFFLGRKFGKRILCWIAGKEDCEKWTKKLTNGKYVFFLMMLFPIFPDDILCMAAGVTNMSFDFFFFTNLITRPIGIFCTCFLGSGTLIPFSGYGLIVWPILIVLLLIVFILSIKYQDKIEEFVLKLSKKKTKFKQNSKIQIESLEISDGIDVDKNEDKTKVNKTI